MSEAQLFVATTFTETYERVLVGPLFRPFAEQLVARLAPHHGDSVVDIACGTGIVARVARERLGPEAWIVGVDIAGAMLAVARTVDPTIDWREGNAASLPVSATEHFTVLTCHQGTTVHARQARGDSRNAPRPRYPAAAWPLRPGAPSRTPRQSSN